MSHSGLVGILVRGRSLKAAALAVALVAAPAVLKAAPCAEELPPLLEAKMAELGVPGLIVRIDVPDGCQWTAALGFEDAGKTRPMRLDEHVRVGSVTKTFTGTVILQLVDEGKLGLDDPISKHFPGVPNGSAITIRQLLQMTSGLYNFSEGAAFNRALDSNPVKVWTIQQLLDLGFAGKPYFAPGGGFHYSNTNTVILGRLAETVTGEPLAELYRKRIFQPLGMTGTSLPADASLPKPSPRGYMYGTNVGTTPPACDAIKVGRHDVTDASPSWTWAAGGAVSTLEDLTIWAKALALGTRIGPATQAERIRFRAAGSGPAAAGYGLAMADFFGVLGHDGNLPGFSTFVGYQPEKKATIIALANLYSDKKCGAPTDEIVKLLGKKLGLFRP